MCFFFSPDSAISRNKKAIKHSCIHLHLHLHRPEILLLTRAARCPSPLSSSHIPPFGHALDITRIEDSLLVLVHLAVTRTIRTEQCQLVIVAPFLCSTIYLAKSSISSSPRPIYLPFRWISPSASRLLPGQADNSLTSCTNSSGFSAFFFSFTRWISLNNPGGCHSQHKVTTLIT